MNRTPGFQESFDAVTRQIFGKTVKEAQEQGKCITCGQVVHPEVYTEVARDEFEISGMCSDCQEEVFETEEAIGETKLTTCNSIEELVKYLYDN